MANAQTVIVYVVLGILCFFAVVLLVNMTPSLLAPSKYPPLQDIISSVALTFFAFLGFDIPPLMARKLGDRASAGLLIEAAVCLVLAVAFKLDAIASIGSAVALLIFTFITVAHFRVRAEAGANVVILALAPITAAVVLVAFIFTTLIHEPASIVTLLGIIVISIILDFTWKRAQTKKAGDVQLAH